MGCCDENTALVARSGVKSSDFSPPDVSRRAVLKGAGAVAGVLGVAAPAVAQTVGKPITISFCSQFLCAPPYEVARAFGHFRNHGLNAEIVYFRGGNAAIQALVGGAVDYGATSLDVAMQAFAKGADIRRFVTTGQVPLFAVATSPKNAETIRSLKDLEGKTVGVSALGNADHALLLYLLTKSGVDKSKVQFATVGVNLLEGLRQSLIDAGLVQEPALTILAKSGARVLVNAMDSADATKYLGGHYEFMGVSVRAKEIEQRKAEMVAVARALNDALKAIQTAARGIDEGVPARAAGRRRYRADARCACALSRLALSAERRYQPPGRAARDRNAEDGRSDSQRRRREQTARHNDIQGLKPAHP
jgi:NitT/TauT family transport system substrate-binding protein